MANNNPKDPKGSKNNTGKVTIANFVTILGLVVLLAFTYLGRSYMSGGEVGLDIVVSLAITLVTAFLLWFLVKAKKTDNDYKKWMKVEYSALAVYIILAIVVGFKGGIMHYFVVNANKEEIKGYATRDLDAIEAMLNEYEEFEENALTDTRRGLMNAVSSGYDLSESLRKFMSDEGISRNPESADNFVMVQRTELLGTTYDELRSDFNAQKLKIERITDSWSVLQIVSAAKAIDALAESVRKELNVLAESAKLPVIHNDGGEYTIDSYQTFELPAIEDLKFKKSIMSAEGFSTWALLVVIIINALILFNYIFAYRTKYIPPSGKSDNGTLLKDIHQYTED